MDSPVGEEERTLPQVGSILLFEASDVPVVELVIVGIPSDKSGMLSVARNGVTLTVFGSKRSLVAAGWRVL